MIENLKVRFVRKPQDLDDVLASDDRAAMLFHVRAEVGGRALEIDYLLLACIRSGAVTEIWTLPLDPAKLAAFFRLA